MRLAHRLTAAAALAALATSTLASTTTFTNSADFLAQAGAVKFTETFDGLSNLPTGALDFMQSGLRFRVSAPSDLYANGEFLGTSQINEGLTIDIISGQVTAIGGNFYAVDLMDAFQSVSITVTLNDGTQHSFKPATPGDSFVGFKSDALITRLNISAPGQSLYAVVDNLTVAAVPEPSSWALMGLGVLGLLARRRRLG